ncbi:MAG: polysaccharide deacetylase family protein [Paludibacteraceae bacterium]|jgi:Predicted xylanase/chitin deacetylase|nr:polysaccharide deacetylase family protein [Paludibacteraceae bacterium]
MLIEQLPTVYRKIFPGTVWRLPQEEKTVYLTFDDGPIPEVTTFVLDLLREKGIKATFFCVGDNVRKHPDVFRQVQEEGHIVGNHTFNHLQGLYTSSRKYISNVVKADELIKSPLFRPPHGILRYLQFMTLRKKFKIVFWDVVTRDYNRKLSGEDVLEIVRKYTRNGSIIVFHDSLKAEKNIRYALPKAIDYLMAEGYKFEVLNQDFIKDKI